jgi:DNA-binding PadR family transcriptional regulator
MVRKGWIEEQLDPKTNVPAYRLTEQGQAAFSAKITKLR